MKKRKRDDKLWWIVGIIVLIVLLFIFITKLLGVPTVFDSFLGVTEEPRLSAVNSCCLKICEAVCVCGENQHKRIYGRKQSSTSECPEDFNPSPPSGCNGCDDTVCTTGKVKCARARSSEKGLF